MIYFLLFSVNCRDQVLWLIDWLIDLKFGLPILWAAPEVQDPEKQKQKRALGPVLLIGYIFERIP